MVNSQQKTKEESERAEEESSLKNAMYTSILFVGGGLVFFWVLLFITFTVRG